MALLDTGGSTSGKANVNANYELETHTTATVANAGFSVMGFERSTSTAPAGRNASRVRGSAQGRLAVGQPVCLFNDTFIGSALNSAVWTQTSTTQVLAVTGGFLTLNSGANAATTTECGVQTVQSFGYPSDGALFAEAECVLTVVPQANNEVIIGFWRSLTANAPSDGAYFQWDSTGAFKAIVMNNSVQTGAVTLTTPTVNTRFTAKIEVEDDACLFYINDTLQAVISTTSLIARPYLSASLPWGARVRNTGAVGTAQQLKLGAAYIGWQDVSGQAYPGHHLAGYRGDMLHQGQTGGSMGSLANYANSANPVAALPTNTTAALATGLGGQFWETDTLAVGTDGIIQSFQNPANTVLLAAKTLMITGITIDSFVQTVYVAGGYMASWSLAFGHTAVSLATGETLNTSKSARRVGLGFQYYPAAAPVLSGLTPISMKFESPIAVHPGEFVQTVKKKAVGLVPTSGVVAHLITFDGYWI
jgi:hypothetical protein